MILVTRLDGAELALNCDLIVEIEACPDTTVRLLHGDSLIVRESVAELVESVIDFRADVLRRAGLGTALAVAPGHATHLRFLPGTEGPHGPSPWPHRRESP